MKIKNRKVSFKGTFEYQTCCDPELYEDFADARYSKENLNDDFITRALHQIQDNLSKLCDNIDLQLFKIIIVDSGRLIDAGYKFEGINDYKVPHLMTEFTFECELSIPQNMSTRKFFVALIDVVTSLKNLELITEIVEPKCVLLSVNKFDVNYEFDNDFIGDYYSYDGYLPDEILDEFDSDI